MPFPPNFPLGNAILLGKAVALAYNDFDPVSHGTPFPFAELPAGYTRKDTIYVVDDAIADVGRNNKVKQHVAKYDYRFIGFIADYPDKIIVVFRGTQTLWEWADDADMLKDPFPYAAGFGETEQGFTDLYTSAVTDRIERGKHVGDTLSLLDTGDKPIYVTGHSLGSSLATLCAADVAVGPPAKKVNLITFASPLVGNGDFTSAFSNAVASSWRIANEFDVVPRVPFPILGFRHVDTVVPVNSGVQTRVSIICWHSLSTYMHMLDPAFPLDPVCASKRAVLGQA
jgi:hypothetical protein